MSGRGVKYARRTKHHDGFVLTSHSATRTRRLLAAHELAPRPDEFFSEQDAIDLVQSRYGFVITQPAIRRKIALQLVGKPKKNSSVRPRAALLNSRLNDLEELDSEYYFKNISEDDFVKDAADVIISGGSVRNQYDVELLAEAAKRKFYDGGARMRALVALATKEAIEVARAVAEISGNPISNMLLKKR
jgi:hypothetical protein